MTDNGVEEACVCKKMNLIDLGTSLDYYYMIV